jgi:hypothetical protein
MKIVFMLKIYKKIYMNMKCEILLILKIIVIYGYYVLINQFSQNHNVVLLH